MTLAQGHALAHYTILGPLGAGAMGEVYRARDTNLGREVAIKVLPEHFAGDEERLRRFEREAKTLASLNHPNVAQIHGVDQVGDTCFLVLELVPGESLEERLKRGPLPLDEALDVCRQIAEGLEAAHEAGVIHRDLKPANVRVTPDGKVKVLDFGLAKPANEGERGSSTDSVLSTEAGRLLGTPTYMAPEQARGKAIDRRVDIWAFGCVLYECLTARRAFEGETLTDVFAAVLEREADGSRLPAATPPQVRELLRRCFQKDPRVRLRDIGEARVLLADPRALAAAPAAAPGARPLRSAAFAVVALAAGLAGVALVLFLERDPAAPALAVRRFELTGVTGSSITAISPDGQWIAWNEATRGTPIRLRRLDSYEDRAISDTLEGVWPCFSPDSRALAFFVHGRGLLRVALEPGSAVQTVTPAASGGTLAWGPDGTIVFDGGVHEGVNQAGLMRVAASGGVPEVLTTLDASRGESSHRRPHVLPDGRTVLFQVTSDSSYYVEAVDLATRARRTIVEPGSAPGYLSTGHLMYGNLDRSELIVAPFDPSSLRITGPAVVAVPGVARRAMGMCYSVSSDGTLVYDPEEAESLLVWFDRAGERTTLDAEIGRWTQPRLSPDGRRLLVRQVLAPNCYLWVMDLERGVKSRLEVEGDPHDALWSSDGRAVLYDGRGPGGNGVFRWNLDGGEPERLAESAQHELSCTSLFPDGRLAALVSTEAPGTAPDIEILDLSSGQRTSFLKTKADETRPVFSPDGRALAYLSDDTGQVEVYLRPWPGPGAAVRVSTEGGSGPVWSREGGELYFSKTRRLYAVEVETEPELRVKTPVLLFESEARSSLAGAFDVAADGRFVAAVSSQDADEATVSHVVTGWFEEVRRLAPTEPAR